ncbi:MAG TPA: hypothetical protein VGC09_03060 [Rhodopila sp.]
MLDGNVACLIAGAAGVLLFHPTDAWHAVMTWTVSQVLVSPYSLWVNARALGVNMIRPLTGGLAWEIRSLIHGSTRSTKLRVGGEADLRGYEP